MESSFGFNFCFAMTFIPSTNKLSMEIRERRMCFAGHCSKGKDESVSRLILWTPQDGRRNHGRPALTYTNILQMDLGLESADYKTAMGDKKAWRTIVNRGHLST